MPIYKLNLETNLPYSMFLKKSYLIDEFNEKIKELEDKNIKENFEILTNRKVKDILENIPMINRQGEQCTQQ